MGGAPLDHRRVYRRFDNLGVQTDLAHFGVLEPFKRLITRLVIILAASLDR